MMRNFNWTRLCIGTVFASEIFNEHVIIDVSGNHDDSNGIGDLRFAGAMNKYVM